MKVKIPVAYGFVRNWTSPCRMKLNLTAPEIGDNNQHGAQLPLTAQIYKHLNTFAERMSSGKSNDID